MLLSQVSWHVPSISWFRLSEVRKVCILEIFNLFLRRAAIKSLVKFNKTWYLSQSLPALVDNKRVCWAWRMLVKFFRVYTYLWGTFNLGFTKMTKFYTFGHISQCRWGWRGKTLIKLTRYLVMVPQKKRDQFADPCAGKLIFSRKTLGCSIDWTPEHRCNSRASNCRVLHGLGYFKTKGKSVWSRSVEEQGISDIFPDSFWGRIFGRDQLHCGNK